MRHGTTSWWASACAIQVDAVEALVAATRGTAASNANPPSIVLFNNAHPRWVGCGVSCGRRPSGVQTRKQAKREQSLLARLAAVAQLIQNATSSTLVGLRPRRCRCEQRDQACEICRGVRIPRRCNAGAHARRKSPAPHYLTTVWLHRTLLCRSHQVRSRTPHPGQLASDSLNQSCDAAQRSGTLCTGCRGVCPS